MLVKGVESQGVGRKGRRMEGGKNRKRESCNLYIKAPIERRLRRAGKAREKEARANQCIFTGVGVGVRRYMRQLAQSV